MKVYLIEWYNYESSYISKVFSDPIKAERYTKWERAAMIEREMKNGYSWEEADYVTDNYRIIEKEVID